MKFLKMAAAFLLITSSCAAQAVFTQHNNNQRTGLNSSETVLSPNNVTATGFGLQFKTPVDGEVFAQPLYVPGVAFPNGVTHNVTVVATENDSVYAIDADSGVVIWKASLVDSAHSGMAGETAMSESQSTGCVDIAPTIGVTGTPVIDPQTLNIYVESASAAGFTYYHKIHGLNITTGNEIFGAPKIITAAVIGNGLGSTDGVLPFNNLTETNRGGLLLSAGRVYIPYSALCDITPSPGWMFAYDKTSFVQTSVFVSTPNGTLGTFWNGGSGPATEADGSFIYSATANGSYDTSSDYGDSILKLTPLLQVSDSFTPFDQAYMAANDADLGSGGVIVLPDQPGATPHLLVQAGKRGRIFVVNRDQFTTSNSHYCASCNTFDSEIYEESALGFIGGVFGSPAYWNSNVYFVGAGGPLTAIPVENGSLNLSTVDKSTATFKWPGAVPSISSNGNTNAIVWLTSSSGLSAYDAVSLSLLWQGTTGPYVKFSVPTVANGKVYVGANGELDVFGLNPAPAQQVPPTASVQ